MLSNTKEMVGITEEDNNSTFSFPQLLAMYLHGVNPFSPLPLCKPFHFCLQAQPPYPCYLDLLTKRTSPITTNKKRMEPGASATDRCAMFGTQWGLGDGMRGNGGDGIVEASWTGQDWQWSHWEGFACSKLPHNLLVLSERWLKSTSETSSVEFQIKFLELQEVELSFCEFVSGTTVSNLYSLKNISH